MKSEKIYEADLEIGLDIQRGIIYDLKEGKKYKLNEVLALKRV